MRKTPILTLAATAALVPTGAGFAAKPPKPPRAATVSISAKPNPIVFGRYSTISGTLSTHASGVAVVLRAVAYPYTGAYHDAGSKTTDARGNYSFAVAPDRNTRYQVVAKASPTVTSQAATVSVAWRVGLKASDSTPARGSRVRFSGSVHPAHPGGTVLVQKLTASGWKTVTRTRLKAVTSTFSSYSIRVRIGSSARYRVRVPGDGAHLAGTSRTRALTVH